MAKRGRPPKKKVEQQGKTPTDNIVRLPEQPKVSSPYEDMPKQYLSHLLTRAGTITEMTLIPPEAIAIIQRQQIIDRLERLLETKTMPSQYYDEGSLNDTGIR